MVEGHRCRCSWAKWTVYRHWGGWKKASAELRSDWMTVVVKRAQGEKMAAEQRAVVHLPSRGPSVVAAVKCTLAPYSTLFATGCTAHCLYQPRYSQCSLNHYTSMCLSWFHSWIALRYCIRVAVLLAFLITKPTMLVMQMLLLTAARKFHVWD